MNPFEEKPEALTNLFENWKTIYPKAYDKNEVDPYTKTRIILMNGTEFEANWCSHQFSRHTGDTDIRRELALTRMQEKEQQLKISLLKPMNETILEHTIGYEQLAVDLTCELAKRVSDCYIKKALDFALLEDFDHLYRYANELEFEQGVRAERLVGSYTEIMPGRPTIAHHRFPTDNVRRASDFKATDTFTALSTMIITAAEQQTMNYYMNVTDFAESEAARKLYQEIALVEEEHVTQYEDLMDPNATWFETHLWHEFCECYLYWSAYMTETDKYVKSLWEQNFAIEVAHLHKAAELLKKYEKKDPQSVILNAEFPEPLSLHENIEYVRNVLANTVQYTSLKEDYILLDDLSSDADYFAYQDIKNPSADVEPAHMIISNHIRKHKKDYRFQVAPTPIKELQNTAEDNTKVGRVPGAARSTNFSCNA